MPKPYDPDFFESIRDESRTSAAVVVPILLRWMQPRSVIDVGCGIGTWLAEFCAAGVSDILGVDGSYVPRQMLEIPQECFVSQDLAESVSLGRRFDLAISLEVAEHLPERAARAFVQGLTKLAPVVLFSAAIPSQGGRNHVNEQWPEYWAKLFGEWGFVPIDAIRPLVWHDSRVDCCYAQNMLLFVSSEGLEHYPALRSLPQSKPDELSMVHPKIFMAVVNPGVRQRLRGMPSAIVRAIRRRLRRSSRPPKR